MKSNNTTMLPSKMSIFLLATLMLSSVAVYINFLPKENEDFKEEANKLQMIEEYYKLEFEKTADLKLGYIPTERLLVAKAQRDRQIQERQRLRAAPMGLNWTERGPNNVSGRTRALIFDKNDVTNKKAWTGGVGGGIWYTNDITVASPSWSQPSGANFFNSLAITTIAQHPTNPQIMYFGTGEGYGNIDAIRGLGIWKSSDGGSSWAQLSATIPGAGTGSAAPNTHFVQKIVVTSTGTVIAGTKGGEFCNQGGIYRSTDGGTTWSFYKIPDRLATPATCDNWGSSIADIEIAANGSIYASNGIFFSDGIYRSTNDGVTWTKIYTAAADEYRIELAPAPSDANYMYCASAASTNAIKKVFRTTDATNATPTFTTLTTPSWSDQCAAPTADFTRGQAWYDLIIRVDPNSKESAYIGGVDLHRTTDGGTTWTQATEWANCSSKADVHADQHDFVFAPGSSSIAYSANDGGIYRLTNANTATPSASFISNDYNITQYYSADLVNTACTEGYLAGAQDNGTHRLSNAGLGAGVSVTGGDGAYSHIDQNNSGIQISAYTRNLYTYTYDNWATSFFHNVSSSTGVFINPTEFDDVNNILYTSFGSGSYKAISGGVLNGSGSTLPTHTTKTGLTGTPAALKVDPNDANVLWIGSAAGTLNKVTNPNGAQTVVLKPSSSFFAGYISSIDVQKGNSNHILVTVSNYGSAASVQESTDGGTTWTNLDNASLPDMPIRWGIFNPVNPDQILLATELGVWSTDNINGASTVWQAENNGLANVRVDMLQYRPSDYTVVAATHGRGIFTTKLTENAPLSTAVIEQATQTAQGYLGPNATTYFYSRGDGQLMCKIQNNSSHDYGCTTVAIGRGSDGSMVPVHFRDNMNANDVMPKTISVTPSNNNASGNYTITLYYTPAEITAWTTHTGRTWSSAVLIKCSGDVNLITPVSPNAGGTRTYANQTGNSSTGLGFIAATLTTGFSSFAVGSLNSVLPVELVSFKGKWYNQAAQLNWEVVNQQAIEAYDVERSVDGQNFGYVGTVKANTQTQATYSFEDKNAASVATLYYRLKIKESNDSRDNYSKIVAIQVPTKGLAFNLAQNPVREQVQILFDEASNYPLSNLSIQIADMTGRVVVNRRWSSWDEKQLSLPIANLPNGTYVLNVQTNTDKKAVKFVKN